QYGAAAEGLRGPAEPLGAQRAAVADLREPQPLGLEAGEHEERDHHAGDDEQGGHEGATAAAGSRASFCGYGDHLLIGGAVSGAGRRGSTLCVLTWSNAGTAPEVSHTPPRLPRWQRG